MRRDVSGDTMWSIVVLVLAVLLAIWYFGYQRDLKRQCRERGGLVVRVQNTDDLDAWVCQEPR